MPRSKDPIVGLGRGGHSCERTRRLHSWPSSMATSPDHLLAIIGTSEGDVFRLALDSFDLRRPSQTAQVQGLWCVLEPEGGRFSLRQVKTSTYFSGTPRRCYPSQNQPGWRSGRSPRHSTPAGARLAVGCADGTVQHWEPHRPGRLEGFLLTKGISRGCASAPKVTRS